MTVKLLTQVIQTYVPQKALSEYSQSYIIGGNFKQRSCKSVQRGWLKAAPLEIIGGP